MTQPSGFTALILRFSRYSNHRVSPILSDFIHIGVLMRLMVGFGYLQHERPIRRAVLSISEFTLPLPRISTHTCAEIRPLITFNLKHDQFYALELSTSA